KSLFSSVLEKGKRSSLESVLFNSALCRTFYKPTANFTANHLIKNHTTRSHSTVNHLILSHTLFALLSTPSTSSFTANHLTKNQLSRS
ncbi:hypothetical protein, partial [Bartonella quintana]|uniref:hypothetical protein n=1 Tax=Bartonella quintana TaxID=803 RepID=UPI001AEBBBB9